MRIGRLKLAVVVPVLLLGACVSRPPVSDRGDIYVPPSSPQSAPARPPVQQSQPTDTARPAWPAERAPAPPKPAAPVMPAAARHLAMQAERASQSGDHEAAAASLERALRIAPSNPVLWQNLAVVRYRQRDYAKVEGLALKSNSLAVGDTSLRAENWRLIAEVRRMLGDRRGADGAEQEARRLRATARID